MAESAPTSKDSSSERKEETPKESEEEDEDYNPDAENGDDGEYDDEMVTEETQSDHQFLTSMQLKAVDQVFEALFGYSWGTTFTLPENLTPSEKLLRRMLGPSAAACVLQTKPQKGAIVHRKRQVYKHKTVLDNIQPVAKSAAEKTRVSPQQSAPAAACESTGTAPKAGGVQNLLQQLAAGNGKVSTVAKTSADWDQFKEKTGLGDKLEEQAESKQAYLKKQDFLNRVDHRKFAIEKKERDLTRMQRK